MINDGEYSAYYVLHSTSIYDDEVFLELRPRYMDTDRACSLHAIHAIPCT